MSLILAPVNTYKNPAPVIYDGSLAELCNPARCSVLPIYNAVIVLVPVKFRLFVAPLYRYIVVAELRVLLCVSDNIPPLTNVGPLYELAADKVSIDVDVLNREPVPDIIPLNVWLVKLL